MSNSLSLMSVSCCLYYSYWVGESYGIQRISGSIKHGVKAVCFLSSVVRLKGFRGAVAFLLCAASRDTEFSFALMSALLWVLAQANAV